MENPNTQWKPGVSPNPGGQPKKTPIADALRDVLQKPYDGKEARFKGKSNAEVMALRLFDLVIENGDMQAAEEIADRVEGKTVQIQQLQGGRVVALSRTPTYRLLKTSVASQS